MKVTVFTICWNEEFFLPYFFRHYETLADEIVVYDNFSTDRSPEIIKSHPKAIYRTYDSGNKEDNTLFSKIKNECWKGCDADWVIVADVDELLYLDPAYPNLKHFLESETFTVYRSKGYTLITETLPTTTGQIYDEVKMGFRQEMYDKTCLFSPRHIKKINYSVGCHSATPEGEVVLQYGDKVRLLHCHYLSEERVVQRWKTLGARLCDTDIENHYSANYLLPEETIRAEFRAHLAIAERVVS